jgi:cathepsin L
MKVLALFTILATASATLTYPDYCAKYGKETTSAGEKHFIGELLGNLLSMSIVLIVANPPSPRPLSANMKVIAAHNERFEAGQSTYRMGVNHLTDEPQGPMGRVDNKATAKHSPQLHKSRVNVQDLPASVDWRDAGVVSPVKNQGHCGSCWAFATTATVESHVALETGLLFDLSPQQLVSCAPNTDECGGHGGCMGSIPELAYDYLIGAGGYAEEWSQPYISYTGETNGTCPVSLELKAGITSYVKLEENNAADVMEALATVGPLAINVDASTWHTYESGVFDGCSYDAMDLNHVVVLVGYGTDEATGSDYWLVRNSWSPTYGEGGYIRLKRDPVSSTPCGVDTTPTDGTGCVNGGDTRPVQYPCGQCGVAFDVSYPTGAFVV